MQKAKSQKLVVGVLCAVVFGVVFYQFSWQARVSTLDKASVVRAATAAKKGDLAAATKAKEHEAANRDALKAVQAILPATADAQGVIRQLTQLAVTSGVNWENSSLAQPAATAVTGLQAASISISISGPMENIQAYLLNVRSSAVGRIISVDTVTTNSNLDATTQVEVVTAALSMRAFLYVIDPATITSTTVAPAAAGVTQTPAGSVPVAVSDPTNVGSTPTTAAPTG
jgi:Tfp pilus assembly protein PilO